MTDATPTDPEHLTGAELVSPPPRWTEYLPVEELVPDDRNPKAHDAAGLDASLERFGYTEQPMLDERTGKLVAGHGRRELLLRAKAAGKEPPDGIVVDGDGRWLVPVQRGWSSKDDLDALAYLVGSNRHVESGGWVDEKLAPALAELYDSPLALEGIGYTDEQYQDLLAGWAEADDTGRDASDGTLLAAADVTVGEPKHTVESGQTYKVGRHVLVCADLMNEHALWRDRLTDGVLFCPYPGPFVALGSKVEHDKITLLLVQPDSYIAGHILDKWAAIYGEDEIELVK